MKNLLLHGLGQNSQSYSEVIKLLNEQGINAEAPDLFKLDSDAAKDYKKLYSTFAAYCNQQNENLNLCGLSLGGVLALDFAKEYPQKVNSLILIGTPYKIPKLLFKLQGLMFYLMPKSAFEKMGFKKESFISLVKSMGSLDVAKNLDKINCKCLILCGEKDSVNMESAKLLNSTIKNSTFKIIDNAAHEVNTDNPKALAEDISEFWQSDK